MREAVYAGAFYPFDKKELEDMIQEMLSKVKAKTGLGNVVAAIVPHAGYVYSGEVAASAYVEIGNANPKKVVLLGPSHQEYLEGAYAFSDDWVTPLGEVKVSSANLPIVEHDAEHSLEVQVPFLQSVLKKFELVPIIYGEINGKKLLEIVEKEDGFTSQFRP